MVGFPSVSAPCNSLQGWARVSKTQSNFALGLGRQDSRRAGWVLPTTRRNQGTGLLALARLTQSLEQALQPTEASISSSVKWEQLSPTTGGSGSDSEASQILSAAQGGSIAWYHLKANIIPFPQRSPELCVLGLNPALTAEWLGARGVFLYFFFSFLAALRHMEFQARDQI